MTGAPFKENGAMIEGRIGRLITFKENERMIRRPGDPIIRSKSLRNIPLRELSG